MGNPFVHVELATSDVDKAKSFYQSLFDWQLSDVDMGGGMSYTMIQVGEGTGGGMMKQMMPNAPSAWLPYVQVDDIRTATDTAKSLGATIMRDVMEVMDAGWLSIQTANDLERVDRDALIRATCSLRLLRPDISA